ncbi:MAG: two-component system chemotaxis sensor kinase CheA [Candidatus Endobugula sp.]|jgi:two-component system chemotaxis sensor kinase CheA
MLTINLGKYRNILISIALFLMLDASVLILNFYISFEIADDAASINLSGRQRMLSQRMTKSLLDLDYSYIKEEERNKAIKELDFSRNLFDETLTAFDLGGLATGAGGNPIILNRADDKKSRTAVNDGKNIWVNYREKIDAVLVSANNSVSSSDTFLQKQAIEAAIAYGRSNNLSLLKLMNDLTVSLEQVAASKAERLRLIQTAGIFMALINFFFIMFHFIRQLREGDHIVERARKETADILSTVNEGLFLVHKDFTVGMQRSDKLSEILTIDPFESIHFEKLLKDIVSEKDSEAAHGFLRLLFNPKIKEKLIIDLNPLDKIQVNIDDNTGAYKTKYLRFDFKRVLHEGEIIDVLVTVNDITQNILLEKALSEAKEKNEKQIGMLTSILHANPSLLKSFLKNSYRCFSNVNKLLKRTGKSQADFHSKINAIFIEIHNFKGEASALEISEFVDLAHDFENYLDTMRKATIIRGQDFLSLTILLDKLISYAQAITGLVEKLAVFSYLSGAPAPSSPTSHSWNHLHNLVNDLSQHYHKNVNLIASGLNEMSIPDDMKDAINSICIQFLRNAVVHGIETPDERKLLQKNSEGRIDIRASLTPKGSLELMIKDDGAGFNYEKIRRTALRSGKWSEVELDRWDNKKLLSLIFTPGFSTADHTDAFAGRGVGMDVVLKKIKQYRGKINLHSRRNQFSRFVVTFPLFSEQQVA